MASPELLSTSTPRPLRVLIVEDNVIQADALYALVTSWGHYAHVDYDGRRAVTLATTLGVEVLLCDLKLPTVHGYTLAAEILRAMATRPPLLIAVTAWGGLTDIVQSRAAGFRHHMVKPIDAPHLRHLLDVHAAQLAAAEVT